MSGIPCVFPKIPTKRSALTSAFRGHSGSGMMATRKKRRSILHGLDFREIGVIPRPEEQYERDIVVSNVTPIGSYSWQGHSRPTIMIPGHPRVWLDRPMPFKVKPDRGLNFRNQNSFRLPPYPILPLVAAVEQRMQDEGKKGYDWASVDFITDRTNLRKLLAWGMGRHGSQRFRIDFQLVGKKTVIMERWDERPTARMHGQAYGFNFEAASTRPYPGCENSTGHHQVVSYDMAGLNMVVRSEIDGCIMPAADSDHSSHGGKTLEKSLPKHPSSGHVPQPTIIQAFPLTIIRGGVDVPLSSLIEMTTLRNSTWVELYPKLFFSQTPIHFWGRQKDGTFTTVRKTLPGSPELQKANETLQPGLRMLRSLLDVIRELGAQHGEGKGMSLVRGADKRLHLFRRVDDTTCLPKKFLERFN